jgi:CHAD domain-containing protein
MTIRKPARVVPAISYRSPSGGGGSHDVTVATALLRRIQRLQRSLDHTLLALSRTVTPGAVHRARTAARRLRAVLCAFKQALNPAALHRYSTALQQLARDLDAVREADVTQQTTSILSKKHREWSRDTRNGLNSVVKKERSLAVRDLKSAMKADAWTARLLMLRYLALDPGLITDTQKPMTSLTQQVLKRHRRRLRTALRYRGHAARRLHKIRLQIKILRYLLEQCESTRSNMAYEEIKQLRRLQECLGDLHDAWCLKRALKRHPDNRRARIDLFADMKTRSPGLLHRFRKRRKELRRLWRAKKNTD